MIGRETKRKKEKNEKITEDYLEELIKAKMEQAEIRLKSSKHWTFKTEKSNKPTD